MSAIGALTLHGCQRPNPFAEQDRLKAAMREIQFAAAIAYGGGQARNRPREPMAFPREVLTFLQSVEKGGDFSVRPGTAELLREPSWEGTLRFLKPTGGDKYPVIRLDLSRPTSLRGVWEAHDFRVVKKNLEQ